MASDPHGKAATLARRRRLLRYQDCGASGAHARRTHVLRGARSPQPGRPRPALASLAVEARPRAGRPGVCFPHPRRLRPSPPPALRLRSQAFPQPPLTSPRPLPASRPLPGTREDLAWPGLGGTPSGTEVETQGGGGEPFHWQPRRTSALDLRQGPLAGREAASGWSLELQPAGQPRNSASKNPWGPALATCWGAPLTPTPAKKHCLREEPQGLGGHLFRGLKGLMWVPEPRSLPTAYPLLFLLSSLTWGVGDWRQEATRWPASFCPFQKLKGGSCDGWASPFRFSGVGVHCFGLSPQLFLQTLFS